MSDDPLTSRRRSRRGRRVPSAGRSGRHLELVTASEDAELAELLVLRPRATLEAESAPTSLALDDASASGVGPSHRERPGGDG
jgi:hypothetical protein